MGPRDREEPGAGRQGLTVMAEITAERMSDREHVLADIEIAKSLCGPPWLKEIREAGMARFSDTPWPTYRDEAWRFTDVRPIIKTPFRTIFGAAPVALSREDLTPHLLDPGMHQLIFVNGFFSPELSRVNTLPKGLHIASLAQAVHHHDVTVTKYLDKIVNHTSAFIAMNSAFIQDGVFIYLPDNTALDAPVHCLYLGTDSANAAVHPRNLVVVGKSSAATIIETYAALDDSEASFTNGVSEIFLDDNARLERLVVVQEGAKDFHLSTTEVRLGRDAHFDSFIVSLTGQLTRNEVTVILDGEGAECALNGLYLNDGDRLIDNYLYVEHRKPRCRSRMGYRGILDGASNAVFTGKVLVPREGQKTDSNQLNNNLLLSDKATIDTKPQLEIFADDVKCTHGATIGGFPDELLFYFQSRGMTRATAHGILTYGFADEIVNQIGVQTLRDRLDRYIFDKYSP